MARPVTNNDGTVTKASIKVLPDSLQVHETLPMSNAIKGSQFEEMQPLQNIARQGSITFHITTDKDHFLDPYCTFVYIESILKAGDGDNLATGAPADDAGHSGQYESSDCEWSVSHLVQQCHCQDKWNCNRIRQQQVCIQRRPGNETVVSERNQKRATLNCVVLMKKLQHVQRRCHS